MTALLWSRDYQLVSRTRGTCLHTCCVLCDIAIVQGALSIIRCTLHVYALYYTLILPIYKYTNKNNTIACTGKGFNYASNGPFNILIPSVKQPHIHYFIRPNFLFCFILPFFSPINYVHAQCTSHRMTIALLKNDIHNMINYPFFNNNFLRILLL